MPIPRAMLRTIRHLRGPLAAAMTAVLALTLIASAAVGAAPARAAALGTTPAQDEATFLTLINQDRTRAGLQPLVGDPGLAGTSRSWSTTMASADRLHHDPNLAAAASAVEPQWSSAGENVGVGYDANGLHVAFMGSPGHRDNVMSPVFNRVGVGVVHVNGKLWVTVRFLKGPAITGTTGLAAAAPTPAFVGVRTVLTGDFDGDGLDDLLTYGPGTTPDELWFGQADRSMRRASIAINGQYRPVAGDFDGDGRTEILWYAPGGAADHLWSWDGSGWTSTQTTISGTYQVLAGDFDADGIDDLLWYAPGAAGDYRWYGKAGGGFTSVPTTVNGTYRPFVGDLDGNGGDDVFWYGHNGAADVVWYATGERGKHRSVHTSAGGTHKPFTGDFDGNGTDDIFWYTPGDPADSTWYTKSAPGAYDRVPRKVSGTYLPAAGDFDGDGAADVLWFSPSDAAGDPIWWGAPEATTFAAASLKAG